MPYVMRFFGRQFFGQLAVVISVCVGAADAAFADQNDPELDRLFAVLQTTDTQQEVALTVNMIWQIWYRTDDLVANELMAEGNQAVAIGRLPQALETFDELVEVAPDFAEAWNRRATVNYLLGHFAASIADCERVLALEPRHFGALWGLAEMRRLRGEDELALKAFERALEVNPHQDSSRAAADALRKKLEGQRL